MLACRSLVVLYIIFGIRSRSNSVVYEGLTITFGRLFIGVAECKCRQIKSLSVCRDGEERGELRSTGVLLMQKASFPAPS